MIISNPSQKYQMMKYVDFKDLFGINVNVKTNGYSSHTSSKQTLIKLALKYMLLSINP